MVCEPENAKILEILRESYERQPAGYAGKIEMEQRLNMSADKFVPYLDELSRNGLIKRMEGPAPTFIVKFTEKGYVAYMNERL